MTAGNEIKTGEKLAQERGEESCCTSGNKSQQRSSFHFVVKVDGTVLQEWMHAFYLFYKVSVFSYLDLPPFSLSLSFVLLS